MCGTYKIDGRQNRSVDIYERNVGVVTSRSMSHFRTYTKVRHLHETKEIYFVVDLFCTSHMACVKENMSFKSPKILCSACNSYWGEDDVDSLCDDVGRSRPCETLESSWKNLAERFDQQKKDAAAKATEANAESKG